MIICHLVNCQGIMDAGLSKQIRTMFPQVYEMYQRNCTKTANRQDLLGKVLFCPIRYNGSEWLVANLFAQDGFGLDKRYADYDAQRKALTDLSARCHYRERLKNVMIQLIGDK